LRRFFIPVLSQRFQKPLGSTSTNKATVCETVVSAIGDYFRVARQPFLTSTRGSPTLSLAIQGESEQYVTRHTAKARVAGIYEEHASDDHGARAIKRTAVCRNAVYGLIVAHSIEVPEDVAVLRGEGPDMPIH